MCGGVQYLVYVNGKENNINVITNIKKAIMNKQKINEQTRGSYQILYKKL